MRGDDGIGPASIAELEAIGGGRWADVELLVLDGESARLLEAWRGRRRAIIIDAMVTGAPAGSIVRWAFDASGTDASGDHASQLFGPHHPASSHRVDLPEAVALGSALDALPTSLVIYGVEAGDCSLGGPLSAPVFAALPELVSGVADEIDSNGDVG